MSGALIQPFKGLLYNPGKIDDIAHCVCPPYDVIADPEPYYQRSPYNAIRLELPMATPTETPYEAAARTLDEWLEKSILRVDDRPAVYGYEQDFQIGATWHTRRGFIAAVRLDRERLLTHEETRLEAKKDRGQLIGRLNAFTSLVFGLFDDPAGAIGRLLAGASTSLLYDFSDELSIRNRFYRIEDAPVIDSLTGLMEEKYIYVADGHHRLSVAFKIGIPYVAVYLTEMHSPGIAILPYHRTVTLKLKRNIGQLLQGVEGFLDVAREPLDNDGISAELTERIGVRANARYVLVARDDPGHAYVLTQKKPLLEDADMHPSLRRLRVNIAHAGILKRLLGVTEEEISFAKDAEDAHAAVREGGADFALLVPPTTVDEVKEIAEHRLYMPPKSTYFYPKILTGLVFHKYA